MLDAFSARDAGEDVGQLEGAVMGDDGADRLADDLLGRVSIEPFGRPVPAEDDAIEILAEDGVVARVDDRSQQRPKIVCAARCGVFANRDSPH